VGNSGIERFLKKVIYERREALACGVYGVEGGEEGEGEVGGDGGGVFFAGAGGGEAVDLPEEEGGGTGDSGDDICAGGAAGTADGITDEGGSGFFTVERGRGAGCYSG